MTLDALDKQIEESLSRYGRYLTSTNSDSLAVSLASSILPGIVWAFVWAQRGERYDLCYELTSKAPPPLNKLAMILERANIHRTPNTLRVPSPKPIQLPVNPPIAGGRASRYVRHLAIVPYGAGERILEAYVDPSGELAGKDPLDLISLGRVLDTFHRVRRQVVEAQSHGSGTNGRRVSEAQLFAVIHHDIKAWLGKSLGAAHLFLYDARDRALYHRATDVLALSRDVLRNYKPVPQSKNRDLLAFVSENIAGLSDASEKQRLKELLHKLQDGAWMRKNSADHVDDLRSLLSLLPQEPGTGIAGHTALTRIPEINNRHEEELWNAFAYPGETWFPLMLSIEQLFGIATTGSMAAVPLLESGQLAGVLFVLRDRPFDRAADTLMLVERAAQASPLLTLYRTQRFHQALVGAAVNNPTKSIAEIVAEEAHHAFNAPLVAHWAFVEHKIESVTLWGIPSPRTRYRQLGVHDPRRGLFREDRIKTKVHDWARQRRDLVVLDRPNADEFHQWALPEQTLKEHEESLQTMLKSGLVIAPPLTKDIIVVYTEEPAAVVEANRPQTMQKLAAMQSVEALRSAPKKPRPLLVGETDEFVKLKARAETAAKLSRVLIYGGTGSGKSRLAQYIYELSNRKGPMGSLDVSFDDLGMFQQHAFGIAKDGMGQKTDAKPGVIDSHQGGTVLIDDIDRADKSVREKLLDFLDKGKMAPIGGTEVTRDVQVIATTNRSEDELREIRRDIVRRFRMDITVPPLSKRRLDVPLLARHFLHELEAPHIQIAPDAMCELMNTDFEFDVDGIRQCLEIFAAEGKKVISKADITSIRKNRAGENQLVRLQDGTPYFSSWSSVASAVTLYLTDDVYPPNERPEEDWAQFPTRVFRFLMERRRREGKRAEIDRYISIGCGAGLDAVAAARELRPRSMVLTDLRADVVSVARENVLQNSSMKSEDIERVHGSLFASVPADRQADVIFENLPVIPGVSGANQGRLTGTYFCEGEGLERATADVPDVYRKWTLTSHYLFLLDAKRYLAPEGMVVCSIGGRMPWSVVEDMFVDLGYTPELLVYDLKEQEEFDEVAGGLAELEQQEGTQFRFFDLEQARGSLKAIPRGDDLETRLRGFATVRADADKILDSIAISAREALKPDSSLKIGHTVYLVRGTLRAGG